MKVIPVLALVVSASAFCATRTEDGGLLLTPDEVENTIQYIREIQAVAIVNQQRVIDLENEVKLLKNSKCL